MKTLKLRCGYGKYAKFAGKSNSRESWVELGNVCDATLACLGPADVLSLHAWTAKRLRELQAAGFLDKPEVEK